MLLTLEPADPVLRLCCVVPGVGKLLTFIFRVVGLDKEDDVDAGVAVGVIVVVVLIGTFVVGGVVTDGVGLVIAEFLLSIFALGACEIISPTSIRLPLGSLACPCTNLKP